MNRRMTMINKLITALLFYLLLSFSLFSQWQIFNVGSTINLKDVSVVNTNIIWVCGETSSVYFTNDGGVNWVQINNNLQKLDLDKIIALDSNIAWVTSDSAIFKTTNRGVSWVRQYHYPGLHINKIHFFNANTGYLFVDNSVSNDSVNFYITRNGGLDWVKSVNRPVLPYSFFIRDNGPSHIDSNFIYFFAEQNALSNSKFYKLTGGLNNTWTSYLVSACQCDIAAFKNPNNGIAVDGFKILSTSNGGANWSILSSSSVPGSMDLTLVPNSNMVIQNSVMASRISYDFGVTLEPVRNFSYLYYGDAKDSQSVWLAATNGRLLKYNFAYIGINQISSEIPDRFMLFQNYPNPFNPETNIKFELSEAGLVTFRIYDVNGREVYNLSENHSAGIYNLNYNAEKLSSGVYYYSAEFNGKREVRKMIVLK